MPQSLIEAIVDANRTRKDFVADQVLSRVAELVHFGTPTPTVDVYRLTMKTGSDNFRASSVVQLGRIVTDEGITMPVCVPVRDMKSTSTFVDLVESESEVTVTKNGREAIHCMSNERYQVLCQEAAKSKLLARILVARREEEAGDYVSYDTFTKTMKAKYGLS